jgi:hypothetical protein
MKDRQGSADILRQGKAAPTLAAIRRQISYLQEETRDRGYPEIALFLGCAVLAIDDLKQSGPRAA